VQRQSQCMVEVRGGAELLVHVPRLLHEGLAEHVERSEDEPPRRLPVLHRAVVAEHVPVHIPEARHHRVLPVHDADLRIGIQEGGLLLNGVLRPKIIDVPDRQVFASGVADAVVPRCGVGDHLVLDGVPQVAGIALLELTYQAQLLGRRLV